MGFERKLLEIIRGEKKAPMLQGFLRGLSVIYRSIVGVRNFAYDRQWLTSTSLPSMIISVGNLVAGGTGKTPFVHLLASQLQHKVRLAILTRGYRSQIEKSGRISKNFVRKWPSFLSARVRRRTLLARAKDKSFCLGRSGQDRFWAACNPGRGAMPFARRRHAASSS